MIICIKRRHHRFGSFQSGLAEKLLLIDLSGSYDKINGIKRIFGVL
jgi:hypothetical protein